MNDLLRLAQQLIDARGKRTSCPWTACQYKDEFNALAANNAVDVIRGYQRLVKAALILMEHANFLPYKELDEVANLWIVNARESLPEAKRDE